MDEKKYQLLLDVISAAQRQWQHNPSLREHFPTMVEEDWYDLYNIAATMLEPTEEDE